MSNQENQYNSNQENQYNTEKEYVIIRKPIQESVETNPIKTIQEVVSDTNFVLRQQAAEDTGTTLETVAGPGEEYTVPGDKKMRLEPNTYTLSEGYRAITISGTQAEITKFWERNAELRVFPNLDDKDVPAHLKPFVQASREATAAAIRRQAQAQR